MSAATGSLKQQAVLAAKQADWARAQALNEAILDLEPTDVGALNRMGIALIQQKQVAKAKKAFKTALDLDRFNTIAKKNLDKIGQKDSGQVLTFSKQHFIEEPGKTKVVELHRLAGKQVLENVSVGSQCQFRCKKRYISVEVDGTYLGALPEDISFRLSKLILAGNLYDCYIRSVAANVCSVYVRETFRSEQNSDLSSFPTNRNSHQATDDFDESLLKDGMSLDYSNYESEKSDTSNIAEEN